MAANRSVLMGSFVQTTPTYLAQAPQQVSITIASGSVTNTTTVGSPVSSKAFLMYQGSKTNQANASGVTNSEYGYLQLNTGTGVVTATRQGSNTDTLTLTGVVIDPTSNLVKSIEQGTIAVNSVLTNTFTLATPVNPGQSSVFYLGNTTDNTINDATTNNCGVRLSSDGTQVIADAGVAGTTNRTVGFVVVQWSASRQCQQLHNVNTTNATNTPNTISASDPNKTLIVYGGSTCSSSATNAAGMGYLSMTSSTNVDYIVNTASANNRTPYFTAVEFASGVLSQNMQRGGISLASVTSNTATITSAATAHSICNFTGFNTNNAIRDRQLPAVTQTNATTITASRTAAGAGTNVIGYEVATFS